MPAYSGSFYQSGKAIRLGKTRVEKMNWWRVRVDWIKLVAFNHAVLEYLASVDQIRVAPG